MEKYQIVNNPVLLLVEDNPADQNLTKRSIKKHMLNCDLRIVADGESAMDYLRHHGVYVSLDDSPKPDIIVLDLNMPKMDGRQVIQEMKSNPELANIPIIVFTTSSYKKDISESYKLGCNSFITKPANAHEFMNVIKEICSYWFNLVTLPNPRHISYFG